MNRAKLKYERGNNIINMLRIGHIITSHSFLNFRETPHHLLNLRNRLPIKHIILECLAYAPGRNVFNNSHKLVAPLGYDHQ